ncbi:phosphatidate phosphatase LPIN3 isoform X1 [Psammomys obesus]|uniref:phosphatidate phosphatase LPIN3 isoform X1 n=1 Tax=Psammomys obesus TaxID=48139 RepID=UPI002452F21B|nr:phosphatidate phosphatase LPIN3 isoform X1 [Psammomys obesus]XP_055458351.1 phosphatidate phosphatase LPIN3 isoform X1 [Psammomys obesus]XP_055458352.1 phosphatidate phosphatase LPIN3 isoform X1 [Psammomys obesus]XP_055458353.1 phosphatidate phosphatase LPIN3 isoform X1 [Psammomys obesus]XP_055458354.1 phosphatidate phosphatase LPIN3 isoform X1 [Psammomys obesus]XP_055458355.1 phosphatidate phosphatase LPIN3 isoform X1 [Psammomys obesus]XP_055458357.1 phosphatidate phosphatase LPIN3 isofor
MNYVGQLAETVFGTVKELYRGLNPATLSGGIDVLVVKQTDGSFRCSPFHVRFGKLGVLRSREKVVDIEINGEPVDLHMKLGDSGEAFFVQELDSDEEDVPPRLCTSPIPWGGLSGFPSDSQLGTASEPEGLVITGRRKRRRRRKPRRREDAADSSSEDLEAGVESELEKPTPESPSAQEEEPSSQPKDIYPYSDGECAPQAGLSSGDLMSPKSDSELELRSSEPSPLRAESHMQWAWGRLPKVAKAERPEFSVDLKSVAEAICALSGEPSPPASSSVAGVDTLRLPVLQPGASTDEEVHCEGTLVESSLTAPESKETKSQNSKGASHPPATKSWNWTSPESHISSGRPGASREKGFLKRNQHLGPSDIYLDDLPSLDSENAALYFPQSECGMGARRWSEPSNQKLLENPNPEHIAESTLDSVDRIALSLCGGLADTRDISLEKFNQHMVSYEDLTKNPGLLDDPNLVVKINEKHYNWAVAAPMILSLQAFQKNLPESTVDKLEKEKMPRKGGRWWFSWRRRDFPAEEHSAQREKTTTREQQGEKTEVLSSDDDAPDSPVILEVPPLPPSTPGYIPTYKKSLRLSSDQIRCLNLQEGANDVVFSVTTQYQGTCRCKATIYLWNWDDKVVISDIDGTITKSDALGHILPQLGKDWTHEGITSLYHKIHLNGYKFLYCSARAIGMADLTKGYLQWVSERGCGLPKGPILLSPSSLFSALHREVIEKKPEVFKVACLSDIQQLFLPQRQPFYAAFGNRPNDVFAYRQVGLPESRIFTVNPRGELIQELIKNHKSTYQRLGEVVELLFPPVVRGPSTDLAKPEYSNLCYWREPLPYVDFDALV